MSDGYDVIIYMRDILLDVVIPEKFVWEFMEEFGKAFAIKDCHEGTTHIKSVNGYYEHPNGWHIQVSVWENDEARFYEFLHGFCRKRGISFRQP